MKRLVQNRCQYLKHQIASCDTAGDGDARPFLPGGLMFPDAQGNQVSQGFQRSAKPLTRLSWLGRQPCHMRLGDAYRWFGRGERQETEAFGAGRAGTGLLLQPAPVRLRPYDAVQELSAIVVATHPQVRAPVQAHRIEAARS